MAFREREFVAILGASGSGKTTCLNIIGGLDRYDSDPDSDMTIKGKKTATFKDRDWDAYRNNSVGFVFQSYNLITHLSIVANVELAMTLSGVSKREKRERALEVLCEVGLKEHLHKKPNQLSGGQMQRVAIARALANNPEILLCDEPTGALDTKTSRQIMDLIRRLSKERLVIMVTHNPEIAAEYADRTIKFEDGLVESDTNPHTERDKPDMFDLKKTAMSFMTALNLSGNNILTKKGRTFLTAFASSIGIIGIAVILSLSNGFQMQIDKFQEDALAEFPILISREIPELNHEEIERMQMNRRDRDGSAPTAVNVLDPSKFYTQHTNRFTPEFLDYIGGIPTDIASYVGFQRMVGVNALRLDGDEVSTMTFPTLVTMLMGGGAEIGGNMSGMMGMNMGLSTFPLALGEGTSQADYMRMNYELLSGEFPEEPTDLLLIIGRSGRLEKAVLDRLGFDTKCPDCVCECDEDSEECDDDCAEKICRCNVTIAFEDILNTEFRLIANDDYYSEFGSMTDIMSSLGMPSMPFLPDARLSEIPSGTPVEEALAPLLEQLEELDGHEDMDFEPSEIPEHFLQGVVMQAEGVTMIMSETMAPIFIIMQDPTTGIIALIDATSHELVGTFPELPPEIAEQMEKMFVTCPECDARFIESGDSSESGESGESDESGNSFFIPGNDYRAMWDSEDSLPLRISGIVRANDDSGINLLLDGIVYSDELLELVIERAQGSDIVRAQSERDESVFPSMGGQEGVSFARDLLLSTLGADDALGAITIYPTSFENKDALLEYLDEWNNMHDNEKDKIYYTDMAGMLLGFMSEIISAITIVLIAFAAISLVVSLIMIAIITYISVLERIKEIGILRALGARKKDITRVFDAETFIIGLCSGIIGVLIAWGLTFPANMIIEDMTNLPNVAQLNIVHVVGLLILSTTLTVLGGHLPALMASRKDAVEALRSD
jgi:ABC-type lipoprotein export system ATPase subunit/ABC-type antimicrobial peptide transport system permease subunit